MALLANRSYKTKDIVSLYVIEFRKKRERREKRKRRKRRNKERFGSKISFRSGIIKKAQKKYVKSG